METLPQALQQLWQQKGFEAPTEIQTQIYEPLATRQSFVAISPTGTGKTLAYLLPLLSQLQPDGTLQALIIAPSQELVKQIGTVAQEWAKPLGLTVQLIVGGANFKRQQELLKDKPEVVVATVGRLNELADKSRKLKLHQVRSVIFDEADYLFDEANRQAIDALQKRLMRDVQTVWISATYAPPLENIVASQQLPLYRVQSTTATQQTTHHYILTTNRQKQTTLKRLAQIQDMQAMVFFEQVNEAEEVSAKLLYQGIRVAILHGQLSKQERELAIRLFTRDEVTYLLTTDMAARGLDIPDVPFVIHYNRVTDANTYIHRSGRTGRMGKKGCVLSLVNEQEFRDVAQLLQTASIELSERVVHAAQLIEPAERPISDKKITPKTKTPVQPLSQKKKQRQRDNKNKGKRKK